MIQVDIVTRLTEAVRTAERRLRDARLAHAAARSVLRDASQRRRDAQDAAGMEDYCVVHDASLVSLDGSWAVHERRIQAAAREETLAEQEERARLAAVSRHERFLLVCRRYYRDAVAGAAPHAVWGTCGYCQSDVDWPTVDGVPVCDACASARAQ